MYLRQLYSKNPDRRRPDDDDTRLIHGPAVVHGVAVGGQPDPVYTIMGWIVYSALLSSILAMPIMAEEGDYPFCVIWKMKTFSMTFPEDVAQEECHDQCESVNKTRYGLQKYASGENVGCHCGNFKRLSNEVNMCNYVCGPSNITCGGDIQNPPGSPPTPFWISIYPVCDPYDTYGQNCSQPCPAHCANGCQFNTGSCIFGCDTGWDGNECAERCPSVCLGHECDKTGIIYCTKGCVDHKFGHDCSQNCPHNCLDAQCEQSNGNCKGACKPGWFGAVCGIQCPANCNGSSCDSSGFCESGCEDGYYGDVCSTPCPENCGGPSCHPVHGACSQGCADGWYGKYCGVPCSTSCNDSACDGSTGLCTAGCSGAFFGPMCTNPCPENCAGAVCNVTTGDCSEGCLDGWRGNTCLLDASGRAIPGWASGAMVGLFLGGVVASGLVTYLVFVRRRRNTASGQFDHYNLPEEGSVAEPDHHEEIGEQERSPLDPLV